MKRLVRNSVLVFIFAFAFLFLGVVNAKAAEAALNNTTVEGATTSYKVAEQTYYVVAGSREDAKIKLKSKSNGQYTTSYVLGFIPSGKTFKVYNAKVSVVKCTTYDSALGICKTWSEYNYSTDANKTMDVLKQGGLSLGFADESFKPIKGTTTVNGANLGTLYSASGVQNTYFVIVQYKLQTGTVYNPDVFNVVFADEVQGLNLAKVNQSGSVKVTATSGLPVVSVRYFSTTTALNSGFDFETEYNAAGTGVAGETLDLTKAPSPTDGVFSSEVTLTNTDGKFFYVEAKDAAGRVKVLDVSANSQTDNTPATGGDQNPADGNVGNTDIGKIILISLLAVLVISLVLVIVQRIVDYRRKLY